MYGNKKKHPSVLIRSAVFFRKAKKTASDMFGSNKYTLELHYRDGGDEMDDDDRWGGCFVSKIEATKTDI